MLKILYIVSTLANTGPTNQLYNIVNNLDKSKITPVVLTLSPESNASQYNKFIKAGVEVDSLNLSRLEGIFKAQKYLKLKLKEIKPTLIHTQGMRADLLSSKVVESHQRISTLRNYPFEDYPMKFGKTKGNVMAKQHMKAISKIEHPIACSETLRKIFNKKQKLSTDFIRNGVETKFYTPNTNIEKRHYREKLNLPLEKNIFISVGALIKRKDPLTTIKAFNKRSNPENSFLILVGDGPLNTECQRISSGENIKLTGQVENVLEYLKAADYFISSSLSEGLPNTVLEALAVGLPCCLSNIDQHKEIIQFNPEIGVLGEVEEVTSFTSAINFIQKQNYDLLSKEASETVNNHLSAKVTSQQYQELYLNIVNTKIKA